jgi:Ca2+-binding EF-hand superfamily protein
LPAVPEVKEFLHTFGIPETQCSTQLFMLVEAEQPDCLDFPEFVAAVVTICLFSDNDLLKFAFGIFDRNQTGVIVRTEFDNLVEEIHGGEGEVNQNVYDQLKKYVAVKERCRLRSGR